MPAAALLQTRGNGAAPPEPVGQFRGVIPVASAVVLIKAEMGQALQVADALRKVSGIKQAHAITGPYDVFAIAEAKSVEDVGKFVVSHIQSTRGVKDSLTCLVVG